MKIVVVILTTCLMQVSAAGFAQKLTLSKKGATLEQIFTEIRKQTGYFVVYAENKVDKTTKLDVNFNNTELKDVLDIVSKNQNLEYSFDDKNISLKPKTPSFLDRVVSVFAAVDVRGVVVDGETGLGLAGASVKVKGTGRATTTGSNGEFFLRGVDEDAVIEISFVGFKSVELKAAKDLGTIKLEVSFSDLQEVEINKGYYTEKRKLSTGSVGRVTAEEIGKQPVSNPLAALYGRIPGLIITQQTGVPGGNFKVEIRGQNSLRNTAANNGNIPFYIVDGVPFSSTPMNTIASQLIYPGASEAPGSSPFNSINPSDIESIEVLKDADATAIYGSRGANGVVLITTKKGRIGQMQVDATVYSGIGEVTRKMKLLKTDQYLEMRREAYKNDAINTLPVNAYDINGTWDQNKYTDWQEKLIGGTANTTNVQLSISGGTANTQYRFGGGYNKESTVFPGDFSTNNLSGNFSLTNISPNQKFKSQLNMSYALGASNLFVEDLTRRALILAPNVPDLTNESGELLWITGALDNPLAYTKKPYDAKTNNFIFSSNLSYELVPGLLFKANLGYTNALRKEITKIPLSSLEPSLRPLSLNTSYFGNNLTDSWTVEPQLNWHKQFHKSNVSILVGSTFQEQDSELLSQVAQGFINETSMENIEGVPNEYIGNSYKTSRYRYNAIFARVNYHYDSRYIINLTGRRDGSSRFGPNRQFGSFGAIGAAWIFSEEKMVKAKWPVLSYGKIRGSFGITGSDQIPNYAFLDLYNFTTFTYNGTKGLGPTQLYNPDFSWEENKKLELAVDLGFLKDKLLLTVACYRNRSSNQLLNYPLPPTAGFPFVTTNGTATVQNTGIEFVLNTNNIKTNTFNWQSSLNLSVPHNKLVSYPNLAGSSYANTYVVGEPLSIRKLYRYIGINQANGLYQVMDLDNNGLYNTLDRQIIKFIGQKFSGGLNNSLEWKSLKLDFLMQFVKQDGSNYLSFFGVPGQGVGNQQPIEVMNRWQKSGDDTSIQKFTTNPGTSYSNYANSDGVVSDASFIRLKNISLSYKLPASVLTRMKVKGLRIYAQGQNLLTFTNYKGLDPESQGINLPPLFFLTGGIQLTL